MYMYYLLGYLLVDNPKLSEERKEARAENTYLLALDGDIDFQVFQVFTPTSHESISDLLPLQLFRILSILFNKLALWKTPSYGILVTIFVLIVAWGGDEAGWSNEEKQKSWCSLRAYFTHGKNYHNIVGLKRIIKNV